MHHMTNSVSTTALHAIPPLFLLSLTHTFACCGGELRPLYVCLWLRSTQVFSSPRRETLTTTKKKKGFASSALRMRAAIAHERSGQCSGTGEREWAVCRSCTEAAGRRGAACVAFLFRLLLPHLVPSCSLTLCNVSPYLKLNTWKWRALFPILFFPSIKTVLFTFLV